MKFVKDTEDNLLQTLEYDLDDCCRRNDAPVGVMILCALLNCKEFSVTCLIADEESETGTVPEKVRIDSSRIADFSGVGVLAEMFRKFGLRKWLVKGKYQNAAVTFSAIESAVCILKKGLPRKDIV